MVGLVIILQIYYLLIFHYHITILILDHSKYTVFFPAGTYLPFGICLSNPVSLLTDSELFSGEVLEGFVILSAILLLIKSLVASCFCSFIIFFLKQFYVHQWQIV